MDQVLGFEVICAVQDQVFAGDELLNIFTSDPQVMGVDVHKWIQCGEFLLSNDGFLLPHNLGCVKRLPVDVGDTDPVKIHHIKVAYSGGGEGREHRTSQAPGPDHQDPCSC